MRQPRTTIEYDIYPGESLNRDLFTGDLISGRDFVNPDPRVLKGMITSLGYCPVFGKYNANASIAPVGIHPQLAVVADVAMGFLLPRQLSHETALIASSALRDGRVEIIAELKGQRGSRDSEHTQAVMYALSRRLAAVTVGCYAMGQELSAIEPTRGLVSTGEVHFPEENLTTTYQWEFGQH